MTMRLSIGLSVLIALVVLVSDSGMAQEVQPRPPRPGRPVQDIPAERIEKPTQEAPPIQSVDDPLSRALASLAQQIGQLSSEVRKLRTETERNSAVMELLLYEERLGRVEAKLDDELRYKSDLDSREQEVMRRQRNIQQELTLRGGAALRREEAETALKGEFQRALDETRTQQAASQQRIADLQLQAVQLRQRIEVLRKRLERLEGRSEAQKQTDQ